MRDYKREIKKLKLDILKDILEAARLIITGSILIIIELVIKLIPLVWIYNLLERKSNWDFQCIDFFEDAAGIIYCTKETKRQIKYLKSQQKEEEKRLAREQVQKEKKEEVKPLNNYVLEYIRTLLIKSKQLSAKEQREFITRLRDILTDYMNKYKEILINSTNEAFVLSTMNIDLLNQTTLKKLVIIEDSMNDCLKVQKQLELLTKEESEVLSAIDITDEIKPNEQSQTLTLTK